MSLTIVLVMESYYLHSLTNSLDVMQQHYLHSIPKRKSCARRVVLIFRKGTFVKVDTDTGQKVDTLHTNMSLSNYIKPKKDHLFGYQSLSHLLHEGDSYSRRYLWHNYCHR